MKNKNRMLLILSVTALAGLLYLGWLLRPRENYLWLKTYEDGLNQPYDFGMFKALLRQRASESFKTADAPIARVLPDLERDSPVLYLFCGGSLYMSPKDLSALLRFVESGNKALLIAEAVPDTLKQALYHRFGLQGSGRFNAAAVQVRGYGLDGKAFSFRFRSAPKDSSTATDWYYYKMSEDSAGAIREPQFLQYLNAFGDSASAGLPGLIACHMGRGTLYLHSAPVLFSNYALRNKSGFEYLNAVFKNLEVQTVLYDAYSRTDRPDASVTRRQSDSPLGYILRQDALRMAWYLFLAAACIYLIWGTARRQKVIPLIRRRSNSSVQYAGTLAKLYAERADYGKLCALDMQLFQNNLKQRLRIGGNLSDPEQVRQAALLSGVPQQELEAILRCHERISRKREANARDLTELHNRIAHFYHLYNSKPLQ